MGRYRQYDNHAERQRAYRERKAEELRRLRTADGSDTKPETSVTKPAPAASPPEDAAEALKLWFEGTTEADREEFASRLSDNDLRCLLPHSGGPLLWQLCGLALQRGVLRGHALRPTARGRQSLRTR